MIRSKRMLCVWALQAVGGCTLRHNSFIQASAELIAPLVPTLVDAVSDKLFSCDAPKRQFMMRNSGFKCTVAEDLESPSIDDAQLEFRKEHLAVSISPS